MQEGCINIKTAQLLLGSAWLHKQEQSLAVQILLQQFADQARF